MKCNFYDITKIVKIAMMNKTRVLIVEIFLSRQTNILIDFMKIQKK